jgi:hypothetical protein
VVKNWGGLAIGQMPDELEYFFVGWAGGKFLTFTWPELPLADIGHHLDKIIFGS